MRGTDAMIGLLRSAGSDARAAAAGFQAVLFHVLGFAAIEATYALMTEGRVAAEFAATDAALAALPAARFPHLAEARPYLFPADLTAQFDHGLRLLLEGLVSDAQRAGRRVPAPRPGGGPYDR